MTLRTALRHLREPITVHLRPSDVPLLLGGIREASRRPAGQGAAIEAETCAPDDGVVIG